MPTSNIYRYICQGTPYTLLLLTVGDSCVGQQQLNGTPSKNTLQLSEFKENQCTTSL